MTGLSKRPAVVSLLSKAATAFFAVCAGLFSCTPHDEPPELEISPEPVKNEALPEPAAASYLESLDKITGSSGSLYDATADVRFMLIAQQQEQLGHLKEATTAWFEALGIAETRFGKKALEGWVKAYAKELGKQTDRLVLAKLILAEARNGHHSPYMISRNLTTDAALVPILEAAIPEWLTPLPEAASTTPDLSAPKTQIPVDDPLLVKTAAEFCKAKKVQELAWDSWKNSFSTNEKAYWDALVLQCLGKDIEALKAFKEIYPQLLKSSGPKEKANFPWALESMTRAVILERAVGERSVAADRYVELMELWKKPQLTAKALGLEPIDLALRRINDTLWAGRYRALIADYERGKIYAQSALEQITNAYGVQRNLSSKDKDALVSYKAEAYHDLAYRIALENKQFESALSLTTLALQTPDLTDEWQDRLQWFAGLYDYLGGHFEGAKRRWEAMLNTTKDESQRSMLFFWLAKTHDQMNQKAESQFYISALIDEYPLSYYATVAAPTAGLAGTKKWSDVFENHQDLVNRLVNRKDYGLTSLRRHHTIAPLLLRAEILVAADLREWTKLAVDELDAKMQSELSVQNNVSAFIYLSRLQYNAGNYLSTISITTKLAQAVSNFWKEWPEQLLVYYPQPYADVYDRMAASLNISKELLMAISRQESGFSAEIRSPANAFGVMQLIRPTALRFAAEAGIPANEVDDSLRNPEMNINMGSRYLKRLSLEYKGFPPAVYGAYNAGEPAVDIWLKRRAHSDPLTFVELVPFGETKSYIRNVWRNVMVYSFLGAGHGSPIAMPRIEITPKDKNPMEMSNNPGNIIPVRTYAE